MVCLAGVLFGANVGSSAAGVESCNDYGFLGKHKHRELGFSLLLRSLEVRAMGPPVAREALGPVAPSLPPQSRGANDFMVHRMAQRASQSATQIG